MIPQKGISQEGLKLLACATMLIDHIGAVFFPSAQWLRIIGRISFPIYCFLIAEGVHYTSNPIKYGLRLLLVAMLAELPYDLLFYGKLTWVKNSVMLTLLLGFGAGITMKQVGLRWKPVVSLPFILLGRYLGGSYGMYGVAMVVMFLLTQHIPYAMAVQLFAMILLSLRMAGFPSRVGVQIYAIAAMIPIFLYSGQKHSHNKAMQWAFTLFYPVHMGILLLIRGF
jgi:hypothetical protein